jgi:carbon monoxide dehydrogenase subunit G
MSRRIESQRVIINCQPQKIYDFLSNFDNFTKLLPDQVSNWHSTGDSCSFEVKGLATIGLRITSKTPYTEIIMIGEGKLPFGFTFETFIRQADTEQCQVQMVIDADMNPFIAMMAEKPLQNFVDMIIPKLKEEMEKE